MKMILVLFATLGFGCSGGGQNTSADGPPRCLDFCAMEFTQCTERNPGDYSACSDGRRSCDQECRAQHSESEVTGNAKIGVEPNEKIPSQPSEPAEPVEPDEKPTDVPPAE